MTDLEIGNDHAIDGDDVGQSSIPTVSKNVTDCEGPEPEAHSKTKTTKKYQEKTKLVLKVARQRATKEPYLNDVCNIVTIPYPHWATDKIHATSLTWSTFWRPPSPKYRGRHMSILPKGLGWFWRDMRKSHLLWVKIIFLFQSASLVSLYPYLTIHMR